MSSLPVERGFDHSQCTESACSAYNIDESSYVPGHTLVCNGQNCSLIEVTSRGISSMIEDGFGVPLMSCSVSPSGRIQTGLVRAEPRQEYIAISHVWSGGLGNPNGNGLPGCQMRELIHSVRVAYKDSHRSAKPLEIILAQTKTSVSGWTHFAYQ